MKPENRAFYGKERNPDDAREKRSRRGNRVNRRAGTKTRQLKRNPGGRR